MQYIAIFLKGLVIGVANIIPGVSGGTMALVLGIYERMINAIHNISLQTVKSGLMLFTFKKEAFDDFVEEMKKIDFIFLTLIMIGAAVSIVLLAKFTTTMIETQHDPTYGFFFGLILASVVVPYKVIRKKTPAVFVAMLIAVISVASTGMLLSNEDIINKEQSKYEIKLEAQNSVAQAEGTKASVKKGLFLFFASALSLAAMILPGISGSFVLLLLGQYFILVKAVSEGYLPYIAIYIAGAIVGLLVFTKILNFLFARWHDITMGFLTGLVLGSLYVIWPFRKTVEIGNNLVEGYPKTVYLNNALPSSFGGNELMTLAAVVFGFSIVALMIIIENKIGKKPE